MELNVANRILHNAMANMVLDGKRISANLENDGLMILLGRLNPYKYIQNIVQKASKKNSNSSNRLGIKNKNDLARLETELSFVRELIIDNRNFGEFDAAHFINIHKYLYKDIYLDNGVFRNRDMVQDGASFTDYRYIAGSLKSIFGRITRSDGTAMSKSDFCAYLTHFFSELYILLPFNYGNGRVIRLFFSRYAATCGFAIDWFRATVRDYAQAQRTAFLTDNAEPLYHILMDCTTYLKSAPQTSAINVSLKRSGSKPTTKAYSAPQQPTKVYTVPLTNTKSYSTSKAYSTPQQPTPLTNTKSYSSTKAYSTPQQSTKAYSHPSGGTTDRVVKTHDLSAETAQTSDKTAKTIDKTMDRTAKTIDRTTDTVKTVEVDRKTRDTVDRHAKVHQEVEQYGEAISPMRAYADSININPPKKQKGKKPKSKTAKHEKEPAVLTEEFINDEYERLDYESRHDSLALIKVAPPSVVKKAYKIQKQIDKLTTELFNLMKKYY